MLVCNECVCVVLGAVTSVSSERVAVLNERVFGKLSEVLQHHDDRDQ